MLKKSILESVLYINIGCTAQLYQNIFKTTAHTAAWCLAPIDHPLRNASGQHSSAASAAATAAVVLFCRVMKLLCPTTPPPTAATLSNTTFSSISTIP